MSHITRGRKDPGFEEFLRYQTSENLISNKDLKKQNKLYDAIKKLILFSEDDNNFCSKLCYYAKSRFNYCELFDDITPYEKRCKSCLEIFGND